MKICKYLVISFLCIVTNTLNAQKPTEPKQRKDIGNPPTTLMHKSGLTIDIKLKTILPYDKNKCSFRVGGIKDSSVVKFYDILDSGVVVPVPTMTMPKIEKQRPIALCATSADSIWVLYQQLNGGFSLSYKEKGKPKNIALKGGNKLIGAKINTLIHAKNGDLVAAGSRFNTLLVARISKDGKVLWVNNEKKQLKETIFGLHEAANGDILCAGEQREEIILQEQSWYLLRLSGKGTFLGFKFLGEHQAQNANHAVLTDAKGNPILAGHYGNQLIIAKLLPNNDVDWFKNIDFHATHYETMLFGVMTHKRLALWVQTKVDKKWKTDFWIFKEVSTQKEVVTKLKIGVQVLERLPKSNQFGITNLAHQGYIYYPQKSWAIGQSFQLLVKGDSSLPLSIWAIDSARKVSAIYPKGKRHTDSNGVLVLPSKDSVFTISTNKNEYIICLVGQQDIKQIESALAELAKSKKQTLLEGLQEVLKTPFCQAENIEHTQDKQKFYWLNTSFVQQISAATEGRTRGAKPVTKPPKILLPFLLKLGH